MKQDYFLTSGTTARISTVIIASLIFGSLSTSNFPTRTLAAMTNDSMSNSNNGNNSTMMMEGDKMASNMMARAGYHMIKGQISNVQIDSAGQPEWIQSGIWVVRATLGDNNSVDAAQLIAKFSMVKPDGSALHSHKIYGFKPSEFTTEQNGTIYVLKGTATVTIKDDPVSDVPITIKVFNNAVIGLWIGPDKVDGHFGSNALYGTLSTGSRTSMMNMGSMMSENHGSMSMTGGKMKMMEQNLTMTNIPVTLPLTPGYANGHQVFYISTEASDKELAALMTNWTGSRVVYAPSLANTPPSSFSNIYAFKNGVQGSGPLGFQPNVADSEPGDPKYSPLWRIILVQWQNGTTPTELKSEQEILTALQEQKVTLEPTKLIVNCPFVQWEGGSLMLRQDKMLTDKSPYGQGQVLSIDTENLEVTFVGHRGFAPDGSTIYYIATDASNPEVAKALGILFVNKTGATTFSGASSDLFVFTNGIKGTGPMGFQASIAGSDVGQIQYSPIWRINAVTWKDPMQAAFLTKASDISKAASSGQLGTEIAGFVVNCPFVETTEK